MPPNSSIAMSLSASPSGIGTLYRRSVPLGRKDFRIKGLPPGKIASCEARPAETMDQKRKGFSSLALGEQGSPTG